MKKHEAIIKRVNEHAEEAAKRGAPKSLNTGEIQVAQDVVAAAGVVSRLLHCVAGYHTVNGLPLADKGVEKAIRDTASMIVAECLTILSPAVTIALRVKDDKELAQCLYDLGIPVVAASIANDLREAMGSSTTPEEIAARVTRRVEYTRAALSEITDLVMKLAIEAFGPAEVADTEVYVGVANLYVAASEFRRSALREAGLSSALGMVLQRKLDVSGDAETRH